VRLWLPARDEMDLGDVASIARALEGQPLAAIINAGAYTAVDKAESEPVATFAANAMGPATLAEAARRLDVPLVHISTDYVFDGRKCGWYLEADPVAPLGVYGASKEAGEQAVRAIHRRSVIVRTAWVISPHRANFLKTMLRLAAERPLLRVVADQRGCPTVAADLAQAVQTVALRHLADRDAPTGTFHFVNAGEATWYELACAILAEAARCGHPAPAIEAITTADYPTPAARPANSRLATTAITTAYGIAPRPWRDAVAETVEQVLATG
jgi:dTDP-4-dehydrorhamnose reductase